jgi:hypothetical protein
MSGESITSSFTAATAFPFTVFGCFPNRSLLSAGASINVVALEDLLTCTAYYTGLWGEQYSDNRVGLQLKNFSLKGEDSPSVKVRKFLPQQSIACLDPPLPTMRRWGPRVGPGLRQAPVQCWVLTNFQGIVNMSSHENFLDDGAVRAGSAWTE